MGIPEGTIQFQIPMRGNERLQLASLSRKRGAFQIPMRGNESSFWRARRRSRRRFQIPMRGNEMRERYAGGMKSRLVPNPHEG